MPTQPVKREPQKVKKSRPDDGEKELPVIPTVKVLDDSEVQKYHELQVVCRVEYLQHFNLLLYERIIR